MAKQTHRSMCKRKNGNKSGKRERDAKKARLAEETGEGSDVKQDNKEPSDYVNDEDENEVEDEVTRSLTPEQDIDIGEQNSEQLSVVVDVDKKHVNNEASEQIAHERKAPPSRSEQDVKPPAPDGQRLEGSQRSL